MELVSIGKIFIILGIVLALLGAFWSMGFKMPGDLSYQGKTWTFYFPFGTSLLLSVVVSIILWIWMYFKNT